MSSIFLDFSEMEKPMWQAIEGASGHQPARTWSPQSNICEERGPANTTRVSFETHPFPVQPSDEIAAPAGILSAAWRETLSQKTQLIHDQIPDSREPIK